MTGASYRPARPWLVPALLFAVPLLSGGCSGGPTFVPVTGKVTAHGAPAEGAVVIFNLKGGDINSLRPSGQVKADGTYALSTLKPNDGAPAGDYVITVVWAGKARPSGKKLEMGGESKSETDRLGGRYASEKTSKLRATVTPGGPNDFPFQLD